jgi:hypothetical protein
MSKFLENMDSKTWYRMLVCFLPGLVMAKVASTVGRGGIVSIVATVLMVCGVGTFLAWPRVRQHFLTEHDELVSNEGNISLGPDNAAYLIVLRELAGVSNNDATTLIDLLAVELRLDPGIHLEAAIERAASRYRGRTPA